MIPAPRLVVVVVVPHEEGCVVWERINHAPSQRVASGPVVCGPLRVQRHLLLVSGLLAVFRVKIAVRVDAGHVVHCGCDCRLDSRVKGSRVERHAAPSADTADADALWVDTVLHRQEIDGHLEVFRVDVGGGHVPGLDKGLLDFAVLCGLPNGRKYEHLLFPEADYFGLVMREDDCLAGREGIRVGDLVGLPLFCSKQSWRAISARGQRRDSGSSASRASFDSPITAQCSSRRAWGTSWRSTGWSTPHRKAGSCSGRFHRRWRFRSAWPGAGARPSLLSQSAFWISCELCLLRAEERTISRPEREVALYDRTGLAAGIRALMGRSPSTLATAARWGASWLCA